MMQNYTIYNADKIRIVLHTTLEGLQLNLQSGESYIEGEFYDDKYYVKNNSLHEFPAKPDYPANFDKELESWVWDEGITWAQLRHKRGLRLLELDPIVSNPLRWAELSAEKQEEYTDYRLDLLDLPENTIDPRNPVWPNKP